ncbi:serine/threonine-protein kinase [Streptomyces guryensis]|uniref:Protein kinase n=1 Tax=Streptomyces guryensis TaxID=2886947 RepID=A0A9Q3VK07_9ACTN|nr:serine/threonine-protein kinase [Streptomyces guryensis]MCD9873442.1 protein kinase [Streptomyces guryensis]
MSDAALAQTCARPLRPTDPVRIGPYVPLGLLGSGGMGRVYLARHGDGTPGLAAVKVVRPELAEDVRFRRRFEREATVHARVGAPYTPELFGTGFEPDSELLWMATAYLPGLNLADAVRECGVLEPSGAWRLVADLGRALGALAAVGIVHRDFKPSNVLLTRHGAHVIDFGIAQAVDASAITTTGSRVGTPAFMSPEYLRDGRCDTASDVFCCASTVVHAVTGHAPFGDGTGMDVLHRVASEAPNAEIMAEVAAADPALAALLTACLDKDPALRPGPQHLIDAAAALPRATSWQEPLGSRLQAQEQAYDVLRACPVPGERPQQTPTEQVVYPAAGPGFGPPVTPPSTPTAPARPRRRRYAALTAVLAVCAVAVTAFLLTRTSSSGDTASTAATASSTTATTSASGDGPSSPSTKPKGRGTKEGKGTKEGNPITSTAPSGNGTQGTAHTSPTPRPTSEAPGTPTPTPSKSTPAPAEPPWLTECTTYAGTELTQLGDRGRRVVQVQCMLTKRGYDVGSSGVDGDFGKATDAAVRSFQTDKGLRVDGQVGPNTWAALRSST